MWEPKGVRNHLDGLGSYKHHGTKKPSSQREDLYRVPVDFVLNHRSTSLLPIPTKKGGSIGAPFRTLFASVLLLCNML